MYRDKVQIIAEIIARLTESESIVRTNLLSYCNLNPSRDQSILDELEEKDLIKKDVYSNGRKTISKYAITQKGREFHQRVLEPYGELFCRK